MHERGVVEDVVRHAERICEDQSTSPTRIHLKVGVLSGLSSSAVRHYFEAMVDPGSPLAGAEVDVSASDDMGSHAMSLSIESIEFRET